MSKILTVPVESTSKFPGLMSRWTTPLLCAKESPLAACCDEVDDVLHRQLAVFLQQRRHIRAVDQLHDE